MMRKAVVLLTLTFLLNACSSINVSNVNIDPDTRNVDCAVFTSHLVNEGIKKSVKIVTIDGKTLDVVAFGSARIPMKINFKYARGCYIDLIRDVDKIERIDDRTQRVVLNNGKTIKIGTYFDALRPLDGIRYTPYNGSPWTVLVATSENTIDYYVEKIEPFINLLELSVINKPVKQSLLSALAKLKLKEQKEYKIKKKQEAYEQEQFRLKMEEERKKAEEAEKQKRDWARMSISKNENIGRKICKKGTLEYLWYTGYVLFGKPQYREAHENGQILGYLEGFSSDGYRIKFRVLTWATRTGRLKFNPVQPPRLGEFSAQQGAIYWDDVKEWFFCN